MSAYFYILCRFWKLIKRLKKRRRSTYLIIYFLLIVTVKIKQSCNMQRCLLGVSSTLYLQPLYHFQFLFCLTLQIQASVSALRNTRGLPWPKGYKKKEDEDLLDWLQSMFGFQVAGYQLPFFSSFFFCSAMMITYYKCSLRRRIMCLINEST